MQAKSMQSLAAVQASAQSQQGSTLTTRGGYKVSTPAGTDEVVVQLNNVEVLRITLGVDMTIKTTGKLTLDAANIDLKCTNNVTVRASNCLDLRASVNATLQAGAELTLNGGSTANLDGGKVYVDGSTVNIN